MAKNNENLRSAMMAKNDEFYPLYDDIYAEAERFKSSYKNKTVYLNCDDYRESQIWKVFHDNFNTWCLKKLIATGFKENKPGIYAEYDGYKIKSRNLFGSGSFDSPECMMVLAQADIVFTCIPYSLNKEIIRTLLNNNKKFVLLAGWSIMSYPETIRYMLEHKFSLLNHNADILFRVPDSYDSKAAKVIDGVKYAKVFSVWISNIVEDEPVEKPVLRLTKRKIHSNGKKIDEPYNVFKVDEVKEIPYDYRGLLAVPTTIMRYLQNDGTVHCVFTNSYGVKQKCKLPVLGDTGTALGLYRVHIDNEKKFCGILLRKCI